MVKRRSLDDALTPEEAKFLGVEKKKPEPSIQPKPDNQEEPPMPQAINMKESFTQDLSPPLRPQKTTPLAHASPGTGAGTGAINARIDPVITTALLRASVERRIEGQTLSTQREIIADALTEWLKKHGYWAKNGLS